MAFTPEARAKILARQRENSGRRAAGLPPLTAPKARGKARGKAAPTTTIHLSQETQDPPPSAAPQTLGNPGQTPAAALHQTLMIVFGPINYLLHQLGGFDLLEDEVNLILIPAERIIVRRGLSASGELPPDLFDAIQIAVGVLQYGIRVAPALAAKRAATGGHRPGGQPAGAAPGGSARGGNQAPGGGPTGGLGGNPWAGLTPESIFNDVGIVTEPRPGNGHLPPPGVDPGGARPAGTVGG